MSEHHLVSQIPEEIIYRILSYLPTDVLIDLKLSNRQYWEIYRTRANNVLLWDSEIEWIEALVKTNEMLLSGDLFVQSLFSLEVGYPPDTYTPPIPVQDGLVTFKQICDGYVWLPPNKDVNFNDIKQVINECDTTTPPFAVDTSCGQTMLDIFNDHLLKYVSSCIPSYDGYDSEEWTDEEFQEAKSSFTLKCNLGRKCKKSNNLKKLEQFPEDVRFEIPLVLYVKRDYVDFEKSKFVDYELEFIDKMRNGNCIIWKVIRNKRDIGRAVLSSKLHVMMERHTIGVALFANESNRVYGFGNFNCRETDKTKNGVFNLHNFSVVKENIHNRDPIEQWLRDAREAGTL